MTTTLDTVASMAARAGSSVVGQVRQVLEHRKGGAGTTGAPASGWLVVSINREPTEIDGVWTMDTVRDDAPPDYLDENWGHWVFVFSRGRFVITQENETSCTWGYGAYAVNGNRMSWTFLDGGGIAPNNATNRPGEYFVYDFSTYRDTITLSPVEGEVSPFNFSVHPWRLLTASPTYDHLSTRCPPPAQALGASS